VLDARLRALYRGRWKLIHEPGAGPDAEESTWQLFDLAGDPLERRNLLADAEPTPQIARVFLELRDELSAGLPPGATLETGDEVGVDADLEERLRSFGYLD
jgi:arylsulfatase A-like enzyme